MKYVSALCLIVALSSVAAPVSGAGFVDPRRAESCSRFLRQLGARIGSLDAELDRLQGNSAGLCRFGRQTNVPTHARALADLKAFPDCQYPSNPVTLRTVRVQTENLARLRSAVEKDCREAGLSSGSR